MIFAALLVLVAASLLVAAFHRGEWTVPPEAAARVNPIAPSGAAIAAGRAIYRNKCVECHGEAGKGNGPQAKLYDPAPADFTNAARMSAATDGELFYKISHGRRPMPSYRKKLTEEQRWELVLLIRSFAGAQSPAKSAAEAQRRPTSK